MADSVELVARIISEVQHKIPTRHISFPSYYFGLFTRTVQTVHRPAASIHTLREKKRNRFVITVSSGNSVHITQNALSSKLLLCE